ncbi:MAG: dTDP-4-dehydrorhamnose 3,5-epimerase [Methylohalobius sp.]|nr:dTDP-4-dehydrorhamnose 3,5-epimerase [Methylohalobius sp.]
MKVTPTDLPDVLLIEPDVFGDARGFFLETWNQKRYRELGLTANFVQDNLSLSRRGILRGLHYQWPHPQGKLVQVLVGTVFDVAVDIRRGSPTFGRWVGVELSAENHFQLYIPEGFAHGFCVLSDEALFAYKCTEFYYPNAEHSVLWSDPELDITWPVIDPLLSDKDRCGRRLKDIPAQHLPVHRS